MTKPTNDWEKEFEEAVEKEFTDYDNSGWVTFAKQFIHTLLEKEREKIKKKFIEIAIEGKDDRDEFKGLSLYTKFLDYLKKQ